MSKHKFYHFRIIGFFNVQISGDTLSGINYRFVFELIGNRGRKISQLAEKNCSAFKITVRVPFALRSLSAVLYRKTFF